MNDEEREEWLIRVANLNAAYKDGELQEPNRRLCFGFNQGCCACEEDCTYQKDCREAELDWKHRGVIVGVVAIVNED